LGKYRFMSDWSHTATLQLLENWKRCGVGRIPTPSTEGASRAVAWLEQLRIEAGITTASSLGLSEMAGGLAAGGLGAGGLTAGGLGAGGLAARDASGLAERNSVPSQTLKTSPLVPARPTSEASTSSPIAPIRQFEKAAPPPDMVRMIDMVGWETAPLDTVSREKQLKILSQDASACRKCSDIVCRRKQAVFGTGPVHARLVMFGEAPGAEEDDRGEPFVGAAGQLMDKILVASGLRREDVYIMNSLKCRPPGNRTPTDAEIENCRPYFEAQLEAIQPEYIICWGAVSVRAVLRTTESVGRLRGRFHQYKGAKVLVTYHPAYLLRNPDAKRLTWEDMKFLMRELEIPIPTPKKG
jgi:DNA polymerase